MKNENENRGTLTVFVVILVVFVFFIVYLSYFQLFEAEEVADNSYNKRLTIDESHIKRGSIYDSQGKALAYSKESGEESYDRIYEYGSEYAHIIGYNSKQYDKTGLEKTYNEQLLNKRPDTPLEKLREKVLKPEDGNNLVLTVNHDVQELAYNLLKDHKGSIIASNPKTGEIYCMVESPSYDPNKLDEDWQNLANDESSPLLNRSTQGLYTPGSIIKVITAVSMLENSDIVDQDYNDKGTTIVDGYEISNVNKKAHGQIDLKEALKYSSNTYFAEKGVELGAERLGNTFSEFMFDEPIEFDLGVAKSVSPFKKGMSQTSLAAASFGQGDTLTTPLLMNMMISTVANRGEMMQPYLVDSVTSNTGVQVKKTEPKVIKEVATPEIMAELSSYLKYAIDDESKAYLSWTEVAGKTGTAETSQDSTHAWFVGYAPESDPKVAVTVCLENEGESGGQAAAPIAKEIIAEVLSNTDQN